MPPPHSLVRPRQQTTEEFFEALDRDTLERERAVRLDPESAKLREWVDQLCHDLNPKRPALTRSDDDHERVAVEEGGRGLPVSARVVSTGKGSEKRGLHRTGLLDMSGGRGGLL